MIYDAVCLNVKKAQSNMELHFGVFPPHASHTSKNTGLYAPLANTIYFSPVCTEQINTHLIAKFTNVVLSE